MKRCKFLGLLPLFALLLPVPGFSTKHVVNVGAPSGTDDTAAIQSALNTCADTYPAPCTVVFRSGVYKTKQVLGTQFRGTLVGKGMGRTIIEALPDLQVDLTSFNNGPNMVTPSLEHPFPSLLTFLDSDVGVSDMTLRVTEYQPISAWIYGNDGQVTNLEALLSILGTSPVNAWVERVAFEGAPGTLEQGGAGVNLHSGVEFLGMMPNWIGGSFRITNSKVTGAWNGVQFSSTQHARAVIGGSPCDGNDFDTTSGGGLLVVDDDDSVIDFSFNHVKAVGSDWGGIVVYQGMMMPVTTTSTLRIHDNFFDISGANEDGVFLVDAGPVSNRGKLFNFEIRDNSFKLNGPADAPAFAGIQAFYAVDTVVARNRFAGGNTLFGVVFQGASSCWMWNNDLKRLDTTNADIGLLTSDPLKTTNCTIVLKDPNTTVFDEGVGNVVIGPFRKHPQKLSDRTRDLIRQRAGNLPHGAH